MTLYFADDLLQNAKGPGTKLLCWSFWKRLNWVSPETEMTNHSCFLLNYKWTQFTCSFRVIIICINKPSSDEYKHCQSFILAITEIILIEYRRNNLMLVYQHLRPEHSVHSSVIHSQCFRCKEKHQKIYIFATCRSPKFPQTDKILFGAKPEFKSDDSTDFLYAGIFTKPASC